MNSRLMNIQTLTSILDKTPLLALGYSIYSFELGIKLQVPQLVSSAFQALIKKLRLDHV